MSFTASQPSNQIVLEMWPVDRIKAKLNQCNAIREQYRGESVKLGSEQRKLRNLIDVQNREISRFNRLLMRKLSNTSIQYETEICVICKYDTRICTCEGKVVEEVEEDSDNSDDDSYTRPCQCGWDDADSDGNCPCIGRCFGCKNLGAECVCDLMIHNAEKNK